MWYFKGRRKKYKSPYTGKEVDAAVAKADSIPDTTVADAGKVLGVTPEGKIGLIEGGASEILFIHAIVDGQGNAVLNKTFSEMQAHLAEDKPVVCMNNGVPSTEMSYNDTSITFYFDESSYDASLNRATVDRVILTVADDNTISTSSQYAYWTVTFLD